MAVGERFRGDRGDPQGGSARGIADFLSQHQHCNAGFDVQRDADASGRLSIACRGCGQRVDYKAAEAGQIAAAALPQAGNGSDPAAASAPPHAQAPLPPQQAPPTGQPPPPPPQAPPPPQQAPAAYPPPPPQQQAPPPPQAPPPRPQAPLAPPRAQVPPQPPAPPPVQEPIAPPLPEDSPARGEDLPPDALAGGQPPLPLPPMRRVGGTPKPAPRKRGRALPGWLPIALIMLLIFGGLGLIGLGLVSDAGEQETATDTGENANPPAQGQGGQGQGQQPQDVPAEAPAGGQPAGGQQEGAPPPAAAGIDRRTFANRFELGVPSGWRSGERDGGTLLTAPGDEAEVMALFGSQQPAAQMGSVAAEVLQGLYGGARVGKPKPTRVGGQPALRVNGVFRGGQVSAVGLNAGGVSYVLTKRVVRGAPAPVAGQAEAVIQSFRPL